MTVGMSQSGEGNEANGVWLTTAGSGNAAGRRRFRQHEFHLRGWMIRRSLAIASSGTSQLATGSESTR